MSIHKLEEFISSIIQFSTNSKSKVEPVVIDFQQLVENATTELQFHDDFDKIKITQNVQTNGTFVSDEKRIQMILNNLLSNAIKYSDQAKSLKTININVTQTNDGIRIIVEDNGIGISDESKDRVFKMFYRATEEAEGSGIGLYIAWTSTHPWEKEWIVRSGAQPKHPATTILKAMQNARAAGDDHAVSEFGDYLHQNFQSTGKVLVHFTGKEDWHILLFLVIPLSFLVLPGSLNYVRHGKFRIWNGNT